MLFVIECFPPVKQNATLNFQHIILFHKIVLIENCFWCVQSLIILQNKIYPGVFLYCEQPTVQKLVKYKVSQKISLKKKSCHSERNINSIKFLNVT